MANQANQSTHWADIAADKIVREHGEKDVYVCASGITPSGTVHIGNFREIISVDLVVRALRDKGRTVRFIYSWDDYDVFRKVPKNMPNPDMLKEWLRKPIDIVPDPFEQEESYARANEVAVEKMLPLVGIEPEYIRQAGMYRCSRYADGIRRALECRDVIRGILNEHRSSELAPDWMPVSVFCQECQCDSTRVTAWDGDWQIDYECDSCQHQARVDLRQTDCVKLPWRVDWPMRWSVEGVDFEPAGKEHHSAGGSFDTASRIVEEVYGTRPPVTFKYDFITLKGRGGKLSSSSGEVVALDDALEIYTPEVTRFLFAGTRPNSEFAVSFDLDVLKIYEDYDSCERMYYSEPESDKARRKKEKSDRIYELSQTGPVPEQLPYQIPVRHLCNLLQIHGGDVDAVLQALGDVRPDQEARLRARARCAWNWIRRYAPEDFRFALRSSGGDFSADDLSALSRLKDLATRIDDLDEKQLAEEIYVVARAAGMEPGDFFTLSYRALIGKQKGPRLASFLKTIGGERVSAILDLLGVGC